MEGEQQVIIIDKVQGAERSSRQHVERPGWTIAQWPNLDAFLGPAAGGSLRWDDPTTVHGAQPSHNTSAIVAGGKRYFDIIAVSLRPIRAARIEWAAVRRRSLHASLSVEDFGEAVLGVLDKSAESSTVRKSVRWRAGTNSVQRGALQGVRALPMRNFSAGSGCVPIHQDTSEFAAFISA